MRRRIPKKRLAASLSQTCVVEEFEIAVMMQARGFPFYRVFELPDGRIAFEFWEVYEMPQVEVSSERLDNAANYLRNEIELLSKKRSGDKG